MRCPILTAPGVTSPSSGLHDRDPVHRGSAAALLQPSDPHWSTGGRPVVFAAGYHQFTTDQIKRQSAEANPLWVRITQGITSRNPYARVSGASAVSPAAWRRRESQRARF